jgi:hypothetical protein
MTARSFGGLGESGGGVDRPGDPLVRTNGRTLTSRRPRLKIAFATACAVLVASSAIGAAAAEAARQPTRSEDTALLAAVRSNIPPDWRAKSWVRTRVSSINSRWAGFRINPRSGYEGEVQGAYGYAQRSGARWRVVELGSSGVGCAGVPGPVRNELRRAVQWGADPC